MNKALVLFGKSISKLSKTLGMGNGSTWPGHIALRVNKNFIADSLKNPNIKIILVTGTNGKTTTAKMIETILASSGKKVFRNSSGANLLNGVASAIVINSTLLGKLNYDYAILELDENNVPLFISTFEPDYIIALNLFRDQLDRYGEIDTISKKWKDSYNTLSKTQLILNADDPQIAYLGEDFGKRSRYFGLEINKKDQKDHEHATDSILCPRCGEKLKFDTYYFSHLGKWACSKCGLKRPKLDIDSFEHYPLTGTYSKYDTLAAVLFAKLEGLSQAQILKGVSSFEPAFGRQEVVEYKNRRLKLFLSKNPTSFNESLKTIEEENPKNILIALNDRIPDGTDVSWIWDIDFETLVNKSVQLFITGDRVYDLALRLKYAGIVLDKENVQEDLSIILASMLAKSKNDTIYVLPTYSAMLNMRKILTGKKIL